MNIRLNVGLFGVLLLIAELTLPMHVDAQQSTVNTFCNQATQMCGPTIDGTAYQYPASHIRITRVVFVEFSNGPLENAVTLIAGCVNYINVGPQVVESVTFAWYPVAKPKSYGSLILKGPVPVGVLQNHDAMVYPNFLLAPPHYGAECDLAWGKGGFVSKVVYADGTTWIAPADAPAGSIPEMTSAQTPTAPISTTSPGSK